MLEMSLGVSLGEWFGYGPKRLQFGKNNIFCSVIKHLKFMVVSLRAPPPILSEPQNRPSQIVLR